MLSLKLTTIFKFSFKSFHVVKRSLISWLNHKEENYANVIEGLKHIYKTKLLPLEEKYMFHEFHSPKLADQDFDAKPIIMFIGQYSTGKTTLIRYLLERDFPGLRIGPEPTTDRFIIIMRDGKESIIPGNALVADPNRQFKPLAKFGNTFLNRLQCSVLDSPVLNSVTLIDTPGILSGEKQRVDRGYDFAGVLEWFAERVDRIILLFDANKLDISDEFRRAIEALKGHDDKVRIILNKADSVDHQSLLRVYGALMWSLGKVMNTPEVARVYVGSFWDQPMRYDVNRQLFQDEEQDLFKDIQSLPRNSVLRKFNDLSKRARLAMVHAFIMDAIQIEMPTFFGREAKKQQIIQNLDQMFLRLQKKYLISPGDFPDVSKMREQLMSKDFSTFSALNPRMVAEVGTMMSKDVAEIMAMIPGEEASSGVPSDIAGGVFVGTNDKATPFGHHLGEGVDAGRGEQDWIVNQYKGKFNEVFKSLGPINGKLMRTVAKEHLVKSKLPNSVLVKIWTMSDVDQDGLLDEDEFALALYLVQLKLQGHTLPHSLPQHLVPPSKLLPTIKSQTSKDQ